MKAEFAIRSGGMKTSGATPAVDNARVQVVAGVASFNVNANSVATFTVQSPGFYGVDAAVSLDLQNVASEIERAGMRGYEVDPVR